MRLLLLILPLTAFLILFYQAELTAWVRRIGNRRVQLGPGAWKHPERSFRLAAEQGEPSAMYNLAMIYATGEGVLQDYIQAYLWFNLASAHGEPDGARERDRLATVMTPDQIAEAQRRGREWEFFRGQ